MAPFKFFMTNVALIFSFSFASASELNLTAGETVTVGETIVSCEANTADCTYIVGNVYCGHDCKYIVGDVYCSEQNGGSCNYIVGNVYCGVGCKYIAGDVYCSKGGLAKPAKPAKP